MNDSKAPRGSHVDRHTHIGQGFIPPEAFAELMNCQSLASVPKILETPKDTAPDGRAWDEINLAALHALLRPARRAEAATRAGGKKACPGQESA
jgi:deoxyribonuclease-4